MLPVAGTQRPDPAALADAVAARVAEHPSVVALHGGPFGTVATHLPGRRVVGVTVDETGASVQLGVVFRLDSSLPQLVAELRQWVSAITGAATVHVLVADIATGESDDGEPGQRR